MPSVFKILQFIIMSSLPTLQGCCEFYYPRIEGGDGRMAHLTQCYWKKQ